MYTFVLEVASRKQDRQLQLKLICFNQKTFHSWLLIENVGDKSIILYNYHACSVGRKSVDNGVLFCAYRHCDNSNKYCGARRT
jgi:hypothetical protein